MERRVLLEDLQEQVVSCMLNVLKLSPRTVYGQSSAYMKAVLDYCAKHGEKYYNPVLFNKFWAETEARYKRGEITKGHYLGKRKCLERLAECYNTGTLSWTLHKSKQKYRLSEEAQALLDEFLQILVRDAKTTYDYSWVVRRYLNYLRGTGITDAERLC